MKISYEKGIVVRSGKSKLLLDPEYVRTPIGLHTIVTHAHTDHTQVVPNASVTHLTQITLDLYNISAKRKSKEIIIQNLYEPFEVGPFEVEFINAGHLLGAAQIIVRSGKDSFLYTGDFCPEDLVTVKGADKPKDIDLIALDATYGSKNVFFNSRSSTRNGIFTWIVKTIQQGKIPVINIAKLGGAQEIIKYLNKLIPKIPIITEQTITSVNEVYNKYDQQLQYVNLNDEGVKELVSGKCIILIPRSTKSLDDLLPQSINDRIVRCIVTGQSAKFRFSKFDHAVPLSTHASYSEIVNTINEINPLHVLTNFGYHEDLANDITKNRNINCRGESIKNIEYIDIGILKGRKPIIKAKSLENWFETS